jgi:site-specific recombinase XerD
MLNTSIDIQLSFFCRSTHEYKNGENPIVFRIGYRGERRDIFTGITCPSKFWFSEMGLVSPKFKSSSTINKNLMDIQAKAQQTFNLLLLKGDEFSIDELVDALKGKTPPPQTILEYIAIKEKEIAERVGADLAQPTWYKYKRTIRYFHEFLQQKKLVQNIPVSKIDAEFIKEFFNFLMKEKKNSHNSSCALMGCFNKILQPAVKHKVIKYNPFIDVVLSRKPVDRDFLELSEINKIKELKGLNPELKMKRDLFLFACYSGLPYGDLKKLSRIYIIEDNDGTKYIKHPRKKNGRLSIIPLLPAAEAILKSYSPTDDCRDFEWKVVSNQKLNDGLKDIAKLAGIQKNLFVHLGRHTFATTVTLSNGVSLESVSNMLGHTSLKHTQIYAKVVATKVKNEMRGLREMFN